MHKKTHNIRFAVSFVQLILRRGKADHLSSFSAGAAFFIMLSVFPALMLLASLLCFTPLTQNDLLEAIALVLPSVLLPLVQDVLNELFGQSSPALISVTALLAVWTASRGVYGVLDGMQNIFRTRRGFLRQRMICMLHMLLLTVALLFTLTLHVFGRNLLALLHQLLPALDQALPLISGLRFLFSLALLTLVFTLIYFIFPGKQVHLRSCVMGALGAAVGWLSFSSLFSLYASHAGNYTTFYGSLAAIALFMLWLYICMTILLYGGELVYILETRNGSH